MDTVKNTYFNKVFIYYWHAKDSGFLGNYYNLDCTNYNQLINVLKNCLKVNRALKFSKFDINCHKIKHTAKIIMKFTKSHSLQLVYTL